MKLDRFLDSPDLSADHRHEDESAVELFSRSALYELHQAALGLAQTVGLQDRLGAMAEPQEAESAFNRNLQLLGRGVGSFVPTLAVALTARAGFGKLAAGVDLSAEKILLKRSVIGLNLAETAATGMITGSVFKPTEADKSADWRSLSLDRLSGGVSGAISFAALGLVSSYWHDFAGAKAFRAVGADRFLQNPLVAGALSGAPGGFVNVELNSLISQGHFTDDRDAIGKSMYEMAVVGGLLGGVTGGLLHVAQNRNAGKSWIMAHSQGIGEAIDRSGLESSAASEQLERPEPVGYSSGAVDSQSGLTPESLESFEHIAQHLNLKPETVKEAFTAPDVSGWAVQDVHDFLGESPSEHRRELARLWVDAARRSEAPDADTLPRFEQLFERLGLDRKTEERILKYGFEPATINEYLDREPAAAPLARALLSADAPGMPDVEFQLPALSRLNSYLSDEPGLQERLLCLRAAGVNYLDVDDVVSIERGLPELREFLRDPEFAAKPVDGNTRWSHLLSLYGLRSYLGDEAQVLVGLVGAEMRLGNRLSNLYRYIDQSPEAHVPLVKEMLALGIEPIRLSAGWLDGVQRLRAQFGAGSDTVAHLMQTKGVDLQGVSHFVDREPWRNKPLIESLAREKASSDMLRVDRLEGYRALSNHFGADPANMSKTMRQILAFEEQGVDLKKLSEFVDAKESNGSVVKALLQLGAGPDHLSFEYLDGLVNVRSILGDSPAIDKLIALDPKQVNLQGLAEFLQGFTVFGAEREPGRSVLLEKLLAEGAPPAQLERNYLTALFEFRSRLGEGSPELEHVLKLEREGKVSLATLGAAIYDENAAKNVVLLAQQHPHAEELSEPVLSSLIGLFNNLEPDRAMVGRILNLQREGLDCQALSDYIKNSEFYTAATVAGLIKHGVDKEQLSGKQLTAEGMIKSLAGPASALSQKVEELAGQNVDLTDLAHFIASNPAQRLPLIEAIVKGPYSPGNLAEGRLKALEVLQDEFGAESPVMAKLLKVEGEGANLSSLLYFLREEQADPDQFDPDKKAFVARLAASDLDVNSFLGHNLNDHYVLSRHFGETKTLERILTLRDEGLFLPRLIRFIAPDPESGKALVEALVNSGATASELDGLRLVGLRSLHKAYGPESAQVERLIELEKDGLELSGVGNFIASQPERAEAVKELLDSGAPAKMFAMSNLLDWESLLATAKFSDIGHELLPRLKEWYQEGLSAPKLYEYVNEKPAIRAALVGRLARENADARRVNDQIELQVFPEETAYRLAKAASAQGMSVPRLVGILRDWKAGRVFRDLVIAHDEAGSPLHQDALSALIRQARERSLSQSPVPTDNLSLSRPVEFKNATARALYDSMESVVNAIPKERNIVLLGRDMGPLLPLLKSQGYNAQYFLWSSMQDADASAARQWLREVPPGAAVIDTGYSGTIFDYIKQQADRSIDGFLLSTTGRCKYPQLLGSNHDVLAVSIESIAKLVGRSSAYRDHGGAVSRTKHKDSNDVAGRNRVNDRQPTRWAVVRELKEIYREIGLPEWDTWRWSQFVGLTSKERLGLSTQAEVEEHYRRVLAGRAAAAAHDASP